MKDVELLRIKLDEASVLCRKLAKLKMYLALLEDVVKIVKHYYDAEVTVTNDYIECDRRCVVRLKNYKVDTETSALGLVTVILLHDESILEFIELVDEVTERIGEKLLELLELTKPIENIVKEIQLVRSKTH